MQSRMRDQQDSSAALAMWVLGLVAVIFVAKDWLPPLSAGRGDGLDGLLNHGAMLLGASILTCHLVLGYFLTRLRTARPTALLVASAILIAEGGALALLSPLLGFRS
jgi:hypothetical protein